MKNFIHGPIEWFYHKESAHQVLVMELGGTTVRDKILTMTAPQKVLVAIAILRVLQVLHSNGFVHRDLKLDNFVYPLSGCYFNVVEHIGSRTDFTYPSTLKAISQPRIIDFGLGQEIRKIIPTSSCVGTRKYCGPNAHNSLAVDAIDECFSFLYVVYELLYDKLPWKDVKKQKQT
jgi:serine/threonine protein kinase